MKLTVLTENTACRADLAAEHGLSLYLETGGYKILFDMGQSDAFLRNAEAMGIDLSAVDFALLSHGHYDHGGGLSAFLRCNDHAPVYVSARAFAPHYHGAERYIGLDPALADHERICPVEDAIALSKDILLTHCPDGCLAEPVDDAGLTVKRGEKLLPENFAHEQYLLVRDGGRRVLISGCSHRGVLNLHRHFVPDVLIGGFHLVNLDPDGPGLARLEETARQLMSPSTLCFTGHCTGEAQYAFLKARMGDHLHRLSAGAKWEI